MAIKAVDLDELARKSMLRVNEKGMRIELGEFTCPTKAMTNLVY